jgi:tetratricopeptide (TPR) repeat protein
MFQREYEDAATWAAGGFGSAPYLANEVENRITRATIHRLMGEGTLALAHFDSARVVALRELRPGMANKRLECDLRAHLAVAYAGLGQREQALQEAEALLGLDPLAVDAWWGSNWLLDLAEMNVLLGERDSAIDLLEQVLSMPSRLTVPLLELDPLWDPLRDHARFQELLTREP